MQVEEVYILSKYMSKQSKSREQQNEMELSCLWWFPP